MTCPPTHQKPEHLADATFSIDMVETLLTYFEHYSVEGVVTVEVTNKGLWLRNPIGGRQFLGATELMNLKPII